MLLAQQLYDISLKGVNKIYDEQLRALCEEMEFVAQNGEFKLVITNENIKELGLNPKIWLEGPKIYSDLWVKIKTKLETLGFKVTFETISKNLIQLTVSWE